MASFLCRVPSAVLCRRYLDVLDDRYAHPVVPRAVLDRCGSRGWRTDTGCDGRDHDLHRPDRSATLSERASAAFHGIPGHGRNRNRESPWSAVEFIHCLVEVVDDCGTAQFL